MKKKSSEFNILWISLFVFCSQNLFSEEFSAQKLRTWDTYGKGITAVNHQQLLFSETDGSKGFMLVSDKIYRGNINIKFDLMILRPASVMLVGMLARNRNSHDDLFAEMKDVNYKYFLNNLQLYMVGVYNAPHNIPGPYIRKINNSNAYPLVDVEDSFLQVGKYSQIEISKKDNLLKLKIDGLEVLQYEDLDPLDHGKVFFRVRGTEHETASILIKNVEIIEDSE